MDALPNGSCEVLENQTHDVDTKALAPVLSKFFMGLRRASTVGMIWPWWPRFLLQIVRSANNSRPLAPIQAATGMTSPAMRFASALEARGRPAESLAKSGTVVPAINRRFAGTPEVAVHWI